MMMKSIIRMTLTLVVCVIATSCNEKKVETKPVLGTIEGAFGLESASQEVRDAMASVTLDDRYENTFEDQTNGVAVWSLMRLGEQQ